MIVIAKYNKRNCITISFHFLYTIIKFWILRVTPESRNSLFSYMLSLGLNIRDCVSFFNRFEITNEQIQELSGKIQEYFRANVIRYIYFIHCSVKFQMCTCIRFISELVMAFKPKLCCYILYAVSSWNTIYQNVYPHSL